MDMAEGTPEYGGPDAPHGGRGSRESNGNAENAGNTEQDRNAAGERRNSRPDAPYGYGGPYDPYGQYPRSGPRNGGPRNEDRGGDPRAWRAWGEYPPPRGPYAGPPPRTSQQDPKVFCILSYVGILWIVGLLADRNDPKVKFHVNQGIILSIFEFAFGVFVSIAKSFVSFSFIQLFSASFILPQIGMVINGMLSFALWCLAAAFSVIGIIHAAQDRQEPLPIIGSLFTVIS